MNNVVQRKASSRPTSVDREARTFTAVLATEADVEGVVLRLDGLTVPADVPVMTDHSVAVMDTVGTLVRTWREGDALLGEVRLSSDPTLDPLLNRIADGTIRGVSVGFRVDAWAPRTEPPFVAEKATLIELSLTSFPADGRATIRSKSLDEELNPGGAEETVTTNTTDDRAARVERRRSIRTLVRSLGLSSDLADTLIDEEADEAEVNRRALAAVAARSPANIRAAYNAESLDNPTVRRSAMVDALQVRMTPGHQPSDAARQFVGFTTLDMARDCLRHAGESSTALSPMATITRALHSTSDFPAILADSVGKSLRQAYAAAPSGLKVVARQTTARDFRAKNRIALSEAPRLEKVNEAGEFRHGTLAESVESYKVETFGKIIGLTRQAIVNDDVGAFADLSRRMGQAASATEAQLLADLLESNPTMADGTALFHADHSNLEGTETGAPDIAALSAARMAMRSQVGLTGELIALSPRYLVVGPSQETAAEQVLSNITPGNPDAVNPFAGSLMLVVEPRITGDEWFVVASPNEVDGLEFAYLTGEEGPQIESRAGFEVDGVEIKVRLDFGAGFVDHRSWFMNPGE